MVYLLKIVEASAGLRPAEEKSSSMEMGDFLDVVSCHRNVENHSWNIYYLGVPGCLSGISMRIVDGAGATLFMPNQTDPYLDIDLGIDVDIYRRSLGDVLLLTEIEIDGCL
jgi:hypothetical protein